MGVLDKPAVPLAVKRSNRKNNGRIGLDWIGLDWAGIEEESSRGKEALMLFSFGSLQLSDSLQGGRPLGTTCTYFLGCGRSRRWVAAWRLGVSGRVWKRRENVYWGTHLVGGWVRQGELRYLVIRYLMA